MPLAAFQLNLLSLQSFLSVLRIVVEFIIIWVVVYYMLRIVRNNSRTVQIFKGIIVILLLRFLANSLGLSTITIILDFFINSGIIIIVIIFQPEIRAMLERLGKTSVFSSLHSLSTNEKEDLITEIVKATKELSESSTGALITIEQGQTMGDYIKTGTPINSTVTAELLRSIFVTSTPLHDGAVIIQGDRIASASAYYPPTERADLPTQYGARHRAALGISEISDSITIVVSEETGTISVAENGQLKEMDESTLKQYLNLIIQNIENEVSDTFMTKRGGKLFNFGKVNVDPIQIEQVDVSEVIKKAEKKADGSDRAKLMSIFKKPKKAKEDTEEKVKETKEIKITEEVETKKDVKKDKGGKDNE